jgi:type I restriction enzyme S subunit
MYAFVVPYSCFEEQQKIADFLSDFDTAIDLTKQELEKWKLYKKGLSQQMFV